MRVCGGFDGGDENELLVMKSVSGACVCVWIGASGACSSNDARTHASHGFGHTSPFPLHFHGSEKGSQGSHSTTSGGSKTSPLRKPKGVCRDFGRGLVLWRPRRFVESGLGRGHLHAGGGGDQEQRPAPSSLMATFLPRSDLWGSGEKFEIRSSRPRQERPHGFWFWGLSIKRAWDSVVLDWDSGWSVSCDCCDAE